MRDVFFLSCGTFAAPALAIGPRRFVSPTKVTTLSNTVAVAIRDSGDVVLVDVGWSRDVCADTVAVLGKPHAAVLGVRAKQGDAIVDQLAALGIERSRVKSIVATHLHLDHVGGACDFPDAEVVCTERELRAFRGLPRDLGYRADDLARAGRVRTVLLNAAPTYGFRASFDLFGDGEIVLCDARGHTPGLAAVAIRANGAAFVHIGDAAYQTWEWGVAPPGPSLTARITGWRREEMARTYASIRACEGDPRRPTVVPSHDMTVFDALPHAPRA